jgi:hypothetical protein
MAEESKKPPAREPEPPKLKGNWESLLKKALEQKKPPTGWPDRAAGHKPAGKGKVRGRGGSR